MTMSKVVPYVHRYSLTLKYTEKNCYRQKCWVGGRCSAATAAADETNSTASDIVAESEARKRLPPPYHGQADDALAARRGAVPLLLCKFEGFE